MSDVVEFKPLEFLERFARLIPPVRVHLVRYHGALGPRADFLQHALARARQGSAQEALNALIALGRGGRGREGRGGKRSSCGAQSGQSSREIVGGVLAPRVRDQPNFLSILRRGDDGACRDRGCGGG